MRRRDFVSSLAGPGLIIAAVLILLHSYAFGGKIANGDLPTFWLPTFCYLGRSLGSGHIPAWNPYAMAGVPFAADPQSGWMYAPAMLLFTALPCDVAIRMMVVLQPCLAGLGLYWFLRSEGTSRAAGTLGGLVLAVGIAASQLTNSLPFSGTLAWTALSLAACSRYLHARTTSARIAWVGLTALSLGQLAAAHFSVGMIMGTGVLAVYVVSKTRDRQVLDLAGSGRAVLAHGGILLVTFILLNLAYLLPRLAFLPRTSLSLGYARLDALAAQLSGFPFPQAVPASSPDWPLKLATTPGVHPGALALGLVFAPILSRRFRHLAVGLALYGVLLYLLTLQSFANWVSGRHLSWRMVDSYLHSPEWWGYGLLLVIAVLAGLGLQSFLDADTNRTRLLIVAPAILVWGLLPPLFGAGAFDLSFLLIGAAVGAVILIAILRRPSLVLLVPVALSAEIVGSGLVGYRAPPFQPIPQLFVDRAEPTIETASYVRPDPVSSAIKALPLGRYVTQNLGGWERLQADPRSLLFNIEQVQGYNPIQLRRYWMFVRKLSGLRLRYNLSLFSDPSRPVTDLLNVRYVVAPSRPSSQGFQLLLRPARLGIYERIGSPPRASVVTSWTVVPNSDVALQKVGQPGFDALRNVVLEEDPRLGRPISTARKAPLASPMDVAYEQGGVQDALVRVTATAPGILLVRTPYDPNWHATIDGRPARMLPADSLIQGIPIATGSHHVRLTYDDPWIGLGLLGSTVALATLVLLAGAARTKDRKRHAALS